MIDKDYASAVLAIELTKADIYAVLTEIAEASVDFGKPTQHPIDQMSVKEAQKHFADGQFPAGSMGPKIEAAIQFVRASGKSVLITDVDHLREALEGREGTVIGG